VSPYSGVVQVRWPSGPPPTPEMEGDVLPFARQYSSYLEEELRQALRDAYQNAPDQHLLRGSGTWCDRLALGAYGYLNWAPTYSIGPSRK
jgi:hypothetical protein